MISNVEVIPYTIPKTLRDSRGCIVERKGDVVVSHGVDHETFKNVCLPCEKFFPFVQEHCILSCGAYFLKK